MGTQRIAELAYEIPAGQREIRSRLEQAFDEEIGGRTYDDMIENAIKACGRGEVVSVLFEIVAEHARSESEEEPELYYHCLVTEAGEVKKLGKVWRRWFKRWRSRHWRIDHMPADDEVEAASDEAGEPAMDGGVDEDDGDAEEAPSFPAFDEIVVSDANPEERHDLVLADFQKRAIAALDATFDDEERRAALLSIPTGGGKTRTSLEWVFRNYVRQGRRVLWVTHRLDLLDQVHEELRGLAFLAGETDLFTVGRYDGVGGGRSETHADVVLASAASLSRRRPRPSEFNDGEKALELIVYDEAHGFVAPKRRKAIKNLLQYSDARLLGLTATPFRSSPEATARLLKDFGGEPAYETSFSDLIRVGFLARPEIIHHRLESTRQLELSADDLREIRAKGEVPASILGKLARNDARTEEIVDHWYERRERYGKTVAFACNIKHALTMAAMLRDRGVDAQAVHHQLSRTERKEALAWYASESQETKVIVNVGLLTEGFNVPDTRTVLMARPTMSQVLYVQMIGRGSRGPVVVPGKRTFNVVDCVDNFVRHGLELAGAQVARLLDLELSEEEPTPAPDVAPQISVDPVEVERVQHVLDAGFEELALQSLDVELYSLWGELRWKSREGVDRSLAVFANTHASIEQSLLRLQNGLDGAVEWGEVADSGLDLDAMGAMSILDWDALVDDTASTRTLPELVPVVCSAEVLERARMRASLIGDVLSVLNDDSTQLEVVKACRDVMEKGGESAQQVFGDGLALAEALLEALGRLDEKARRHPRQSAVVDVPLDSVLDLYVRLAMCDEALQDVEVDATARYLRRLYALERELHDEVRHTAMLVGDDSRGQRDIGAVVGLGARPYQERLLLMEGLFRVAIADDRLDLQERRFLEQASKWLRVPDGALEEFFVYWRDVGGGRETVVGYIGCGVCGTSWKNDVRFCGECGASLRLTERPVLADAPVGAPIELIEQDDGTTEIPPGRYRCLSVRQPFAGRIIHGAKKMEVRKWPPNYLGPVVIHAGKELAPGAELTAEERRELRPDGLMPRGGYVGVVDVTEVVENVDGTPYYGWVLANPRRIRFKPAPGKRRLYTEVIE